ncbi:hypothetical protein LOC68_21300 [Blastopirellula sp. JC732]|uniref:Lipoprotein n=1 Tax=Blastopirellula sediminis TaxID=2894196 RepID=A0A9X1MRB3_9BACT|nr:hypothetical protein [Blastopirellula sediminis]MCC9605765.1 hypothetical protein [Blastopirellula sediminis]MCC9630935.1 hypothetical protein [Blastopirellula sediminis]
MTKLKLLIGLLLAIGGLAGCGKTADDSMQQSAVINSAGSTKEIRESGPMPEKNEQTEAQKEVTVILRTLADFAQQQLEKHDGFLPFGASIKSNGSLALGAGYVDEDGGDPNVILDFVFRGLRKQAMAGEIRSGGYCMDVRVVLPGKTEKVDAIQVCVEHAEGHSIEVFIPYAKDDGGDYTFGNYISQQDDFRIFYEGED